MTGGVVTGGVVTGAAMVGSFGWPAQPVTETPLMMFDADPLMTGVTAILSKRDGDVVECVVVVD